MQPFTMRFLPDEPIETVAQEALGFEKFIKLLQSSIYYTETPFVYGVLGEWGTGKTSILKLLECHFNEDFKERVDCPYYYVPIWFNAWKYENETNIIYPLLHAIKQSYELRTQKDADTEEGFGARFTEVVATSGLVVTDAILRVVTKMTIGDALTLEDVQKQLETVQQKREVKDVLGKWADEVAELEKAFADLLDTYATDLAHYKNVEAAKDPLNSAHWEKLEVEKIRFVVMVDDLDRCLPETTIAVLESIKNYLPVKKCVFVLGLNPTVVYLGIRHKYDGLEINGREYLEKILNYTFYVPEPDAERVSAFINRRLRQLLPDTGERNNEDVALRSFGDVIKYCNFNNPRKLKRILNRYLMYLHLYPDDRDQYDLPNIVRLLVIAEYFPDVFQVYLGENANEAAGWPAFGSKEFTINEYESRFGVAIANIYSQLCRMSALFKLRKWDGKEQHRLREQANKVYSITRLS